MRTYSAGLFAISVALAAALAGAYPAAAMSLRHLESPALSSRVN